MDRGSLFELRVFRFGSAFGYISFFIGRPIGVVDAQRTWVLLYVYTRTYHLLGKHADVDLVVYAAVGLEDEVAGRLHELVGTVAEEEVAQQHLA